MSVFAYMCMSACVTETLRSTLHDSYMDFLLGFDGVSDGVITGRRAVGGRRRSSSSESEMTMSHLVSANNNICGVTKYKSNRIIKIVKHKSLRCYIIVAFSRTYNHLTKTVVK